MLKEIKNRISFKFYTLTISLIGILLMVSGHFYYNYEKEITINECYYELEQLSKTKINLLDNWIKERYADAMFLNSNKFMQEEVIAFLHDNENLSIKKDLKSDFSNFVKLYNYKNLYLLDKNGNILLTVNDNDLIINPSTKHYLTSTDSIRFLEFYVVKDTVAYFDILLPVKNQNDVVGFIVIKIDPYDFIFPTINMWPRKSNTAQTILYKRNLDTVYSVNPFKSIAHKPLNNVYTMADTNVPIIKVINGEKGQYYGPDYKGDIVYAFVTDFQPYDWYLVVKVNESEVLESFYDHVLMVLASGFVILILLIITLFFTI